MIGFLTFLLLVAFFCIAFKVFNGLLSPTVQLVGMFCISIFSFVLYSASWNDDLSVQTSLVIMASLFMFAFGEILSKQFRMNAIIARQDYRHRNSRIDNYSINNKRYFFGKITFLIFTAISIATLILYFQYTLRISILAGNKFGVSRMINYAYIAKTSNIIDCPEEAQYVTFGLVISRCFAYYCIFIAIINIFHKETFRRFNVIYFIPIVLYLGQAILSGGRTQLIRFVIQCLITYLVIVFYSNNYSTKGKTAKLMIRIVIGIVVFLSAYRIYGTIRMSSHTGIDDVLSYPGSAIQALNLFLDEPSFSSTFGQETLVTVRGILSKLGFETKRFNLALPEVIWTNGETNIYTALRRYIADYRFIGMFIIAFLLGVVYGFLNKWMLKSKNVLSLVAYGMLLYPVIEFIFEERFFIGILSAGTVYMVIAVIIINFFLKSESMSNKL